MDQEVLVYDYIQ